MKNLQLGKYKFYPNNKVPATGDLSSNIWIIGEAPGEDETIYLKPFVGRAGEILINCLSRYGLDRESVRIDNLFSYRPWDNDIKNVLDIPPFEDNLNKLHELIQVCKPVVIAALGNYPMYYLTGKGKKSKNQVIGIGNWRGSILPYIHDENIKVIPLYHPAAVLREKSLYPIFDIDIKRVKDESTFRGLNYPEREIIINPSGTESIHLINDLTIPNKPIAIDIETIKNSTHILSISFSSSENKAIVFSLDSIENNISVGKILQAPTAKIFHFGYFDTTQLRLNGFQIGIDIYSETLERQYFFDTYLASHVLEPELPHTLAFECSTRTREPYYKHEGKEEGDQKGWNKKIDRNRLYRYNGKDTCVTFEVFMQQGFEILDLSKSNQEIFNFEMSAIELQTHISNSGMLIDDKRMELLKSTMITRWAKLQYLLDGIAGFEVNAKSPFLKDWLYGKEVDNGLGLPTKYFKKKVTTNDAALVSLIAFCKDKMNTSVKDDTKKKWKHKLNLIRSIREIREIRQRLSMYINAKVSDYDNRSRSTYKYGPETGRWAASKYVDGTGYNHQTNPRDPIEVSDEDYEKYSNEIKLLKEIEPEIEESEDEE